MVAALMIVGETYRGSRSRATHRDKVMDEMADLKSQIDALSQQVQATNGEGPALLGDGAEILAIAPPVTGASQDRQAIYSLMESVKVLWSLAEKNGWLKEDQFAEEMQSALGHADQVEAGLPGGQQDASGEPTPSAEVQDMARQRAKAIVTEVRRQTAPTPVTLPTMPSIPGAGGAQTFLSPTSLLSWLPAAHAARSYLHMATTPSVDMPFHFKFL